jgi:hypothetical protein
MLRTAQLTAAFAATTRAPVGIVSELNRQITDLEIELATHFEAYPDDDPTLPARTRCHPRRPPAVSK